MTENENLLASLLKFIDGEGAHASFDKTIDGIPAELRGVQPSGLPYSAWQLLEHIRLDQRSILMACTDPDYVEPTSVEAYWPSSVAPPTADAWDESIAGYRTDRELLKQLVTDPATDLLATIPHRAGRTYLREALIVADHTAYHVGQLLILRRLMGIWG